MEFLKHINWQHDDGVNLAMLNDFVRNQFYDKILAPYVQDQDCTDIGFGTGLLSILALKHGARHIRAFENNPHRYQLGCEIIKRLKLESRIELINEWYDYRKFSPTPVTFTETVDGNLWGEGIWNSLPSDGNTIFLPGGYFLEIWAVEVSDSFARGIQRLAPGPDRIFNPGVDIDPEFVYTINELIHKSDFRSIPELELKSGIMEFDCETNTVWGHQAYRKLIQTGSCVGSYCVKYRDDKTESLIINVSTEHWRDKNVLIVPRPGMQQDNNKLYLDISGAWGDINPTLLVKPQTDLVVNHNVRNGLITYSLE